MKDKFKEPKDIVHISFEIVTLLKGIHGFTEIVVGTLMFFLAPID